MPDEESLDWMRQYTQEDMLASGLRVALSAFGPLGAILGEFTTQFVPRQRLDRLCDFVAGLYERMVDVESQFKSRVREPGFSSLVEEVALAAVRTSSDERRRDLAALLKHGLSRPDIEAIEDLTLLRVLTELNDAEVIVLVSYSLRRGAAFNDKRVNEFHEKHADVLDLTPPTLSSTPDEDRRWAMLRLYENHLVALGLLEQRDPARAYDLQITHAGVLLLASIDKDPSVV